MQLAVNMRETAALHVAHRLVCALITLHRHGIIHRDLKPENVIIRRGRFRQNDEPTSDEDYEELVMSLVDFAIAQFDDGEVPLVGGTLGFMCPNTLDGSSHWDPAVDG